jgi:putative transposase
MVPMARVVAEGVPHHITQRGNNPQDVFLLDEDPRFDLDTLKAKCREHGVAVLGYCLMTNHVHLVAIPRHPDSLARALGQAAGRYAAWFNKRHQRSGHLWQNRYYSCPLGASHLVTAPAYVDLNPLRAGLVRNALEYAWSSAKAHAVGATRLATSSLTDR